MSPVPAPSDLPVELRTEALESILVEKGLVDPAVLDKFIKTYAEDVGPLVLKLLLPNGRPDERPVTVD